MVTIHRALFSVSLSSNCRKAGICRLALTGKALTWFEWWEEQTFFLTWTRFIQDILKRFQPVVTTNPIGPLLKVKQHDTVMQYQEEFELIARNQQSLGQDTLMKFFINGLKEEIKA